MVFPNNSSITTYSLYWKYKTEFPQTWYAHIKFSRISGMEFFTTLNCVYCLNLNSINEIILCRAQVRVVRRRPFPRVYWKTERHSKVSRECSYHHAKHTRNVFLHAKLKVEHCSAVVRVVSVVFVIEINRCCRRNEKKNRINLSETHWRLWQRKTDPWWVEWYHKASMILFFFFLVFTVFIPVHWLFFTRSASITFVCRRFNRSLQYCKDLCGRRMKHENFPTVHINARFSICRIRFYYFRQVSMKKSRSSPRTVRLRRSE